MKIGILAYCSACNFGAQLQLLSTYMYLKNNGHFPIVINWIPADLEKKYAKNCPPEQLSLFEAERNRLWKQTECCHTAEEIATVIKKEGIDAIIVGSDAVLQHHPLLECVKFPTRSIVSRARPSSDTLFPNPFWGTFNDYLPQPIPVAVLSGSNQDSIFKYIGRDTRKKMEKYILQYKYVSVRDEWTREMIKYLTNGKVNPVVTPDPVFAFNQNAGDLVLSKEDLIRKFNLSENYIILSFHGAGIVSQQWIEDFQILAEKDGYQCVKLPYADREGYGRIEKVISLPLSPLDWYGLIKYSQGYVGENMHPIIVSLHNGLPVFSFDNYGRKRFNGLITDDSTSKINHILKLAGLDKNRLSTINKSFKLDNAQTVYQTLRATDASKISLFAEKYYEAYKANMETILNFLTV